MTQYKVLYMPSDLRSGDLSCTAGSRADAREGGSAGGKGPPRGLLETALPVGITRPSRGPGAHGG